MNAPLVLGCLVSFCAFCEVGIGHPLAEAKLTQSRTLHATRLPTTNYYKPTTSDLSGKWYASVQCGVGSGRYIYYFEQMRNGRLSGKSRGVSFGVKDISGSLVTGSSTTTRFKFFEKVSEGYFIEVSGSTKLEQGYVLATYKNTRVDKECKLRMKKMRDQRPINY